MKEITDLSNFISPKETVVTIGTFDGVHLGHRKIIKKLVELAEKEALLSTIFTFFPHPRAVIQQDNGLKLICTQQEKNQILASLGVNQLVVCPFDKTFSKMTAEEFVTEILVKRLKAKIVIVGYDHRFGCNREADITDMKRFGAIYGFQVEEISAQEINAVSVSSTKIRNALNQGDVKTAWDYLGNPFSITGKVIHGLKIGRTIGFPTANLYIGEDYKLIPKDGIYVIYSIINNKKVYGMMSIGTNPTIEGKGASIEAHFFDFQEDIYNKEIQVFFLQRLRDEQKFDSVDGLKIQLQQDALESRRFIDSL
ncbi:bifunctional riboflavin kinase/FAD synthetase [Capnocytophaga sp.]|uniref:bifunctional riboflavin kinase/FAD synthetase n=1 Tax=Capnocytophaga sp. TaxID=44737 RepID=UPI0026DD4027|nr:bifunctional riboflavin kinase/FAD synthetase [Capnocytophaga sp.]MDO5106342.1 bifunctional riboflavin kinase/FAD synthetase [Capnocytophaga sp.]